MWFFVALDLLDIAICSHLWSLPADGSEVITTPGKGCRYFRRVGSGHK